MNYRGLKVVVLGLGESGQAAAELLHQKGAEVMIRDSKINEKMEKIASGFRERGIHVELGNQSSAVCRFDLGVLSPGINPEVPLVKQLKQGGTPMIGELELAYRFCECPVVAITGTNGKSTTTELVAAVLNNGGKKTVACGNIGQAFSRTVKDSNSYDAITVEVSSFQLEGISEFKPKISIYTNFTPDHLDRYKSMDEYWEAKARIFLNQDEDDFAIINTGCRYPQIKAKKITFNALGGEALYTFRNGNLMCGNEIVLEQSRTHLRGPHNAENQLCAIAVGDIYGVPRSIIVETLCEYKALPHRCEVIRVLDGVTYINDSKATNIDAMEKALVTQDSPVVLIAGGKDKGFDFADALLAVKARVKHAVLIGEMQEKIYKAWHKEISCHKASDLADAVKISRKLASSGEVVLLSPGCSSYDMFKNFEERGDIFRKIIMEEKK